MTHSTPPPDRPDARRAAALIAASAAVFAAFLAFSAVRAPVPAVNEPHYLGKAKHFWDAAYAPGDLFFESSNPHFVFYVAVGPLTRFLSLAATAWVGRVVGYGLLAVGWTLLARRLTGSALAALPAAGVFLAAAAVGNLSGEWLVGGIESKTFAYALLLAGWAWRLDGRPTLAAAALGGAVSFHPVVGVWGTGCAVAAEVAVRWAGRRRAAIPAPRPQAESDRVGPAVPAAFDAEAREKHRGRNTAGPTSVAVFLAAALPGLIPAVLALGGEDAAAAARATYLQVFHRLRHHLDPTTFSPRAVAAYGLMLAAWLVLWFRRPSEKTGSGWHALTQEGRATPPELDAARDRFAGLVLAAVAVAAAGAAIGWHGGSAWTMPQRDLRGTLLKFYPFRLADVLVPTAFAIALGGTLTRRWSGFGPVSAALPGAVFAGGLAVALVAPAIDRDPTRLPPGRKAAWVAACEWVGEHTPADARVVAPPGAWGFKWYAGRAEYVGLKDAPQDAAGLLEWERRLGVLGDWWAKPGGAFTAADLRDLGERTDAGWLLTRFGAERFRATPAYDNGFYRVYRLR